MVVFDTLWYSVCVRLSLTISVVHNQGTPFGGGFVPSASAVFLNCQVPFWHVPLPTLLHSRSQDNHHPTRHTFVMNQIFYVEELVRQIAFNADDGSQGSSSLLALACCCKIIEGPVMDVLWQRQKHLHIILRTLAENRWAIIGESYVSRIDFIFQRYSIPKNSVHHPNPHNG